MFLIFVLSVLLKTFECLETDIINLMEKHAITPDVLDTLPNDVIEVSYGGGNHKVDKGNVLTPTQVKDQPTVSWQTKPSTYYTLAMVDPDAPSRATPRLRAWQHWLVVNIPGSEVKKGETLVEYVGAAPPKDSGLHRYVFIVLKQLKKQPYTMEKITKKSSSGRQSFDIKKFAVKYKLEPVAANLFQAEYDSYCPVIYKQLSGK